MIGINHPFVCNIADMNSCYDTGIVHVFGWRIYALVTHICVSKLTIIGSDNGLPPCRRQAITETNTAVKS